MTKSKAEKKRNAQLQSDNYVSGKLFQLQDKLPTITELGSFAGTLTALFPLVSGLSHSVQKLISSGI